MADFNWIIVGGFFAGALAGGAARYGKLCTMSAIEDALVASDFRGLRAWGLALAVAIASTQAASALGQIDLSRVLYAAPRVHLLGTIVGGAMFGLGMTLVGTCGFGLLVRAGGGDLRAGMSALIVGIFAIAATAGLLSPVRMAMLEYGAFDMSAFGGSTVGGMIAKAFGPATAFAAVSLVACALLLTALSDGRFRQRPRLVSGAILMGLSIAAGWIATARAVDALLLDRAESLSFVAPTGRALLQFMADPFRQTGFGVSAMFGVLAASCALAWLRDEVRSEAFDDATEMRRHVIGGALMGIGGVLAQGCTIGQGLSAASTLAVTAPVFVASVFAGAKLGLMHLIEGRSLWRLGR